MFNDFKSPTVVSDRNGLSKEMNQDAGNEESEACDVTGGQEVALGWKEVLGDSAEGPGAGKTLWVCASWALARSLPITFT